MVDWRLDSSCRDRRGVRVLAIRRRVQYRFFGRRQQHVGARHDGIRLKRIRLKRLRLRFGRLRFGLKRLQPCSPRWRLHEPVIVVPLRANDRVIRYVVRIA
jgi:hypothetical protein